MNFVPLEVTHQTFEFDDYESVKSLLTLKLINAAHSRELLGQIPHQKILDLAVVPFINCGTDNDTLRTITITNQILEYWGVSEKQLFEDAFNQMMKSEPPLFRTLCADMKGFNGHYTDIPDEMCEDYEIQSSFIVTKENRAYGAVCLFYPGMIEHIRDLIGPYYVIPSSVHEMILIKDQPPYTANDLSSMLHQVNKTVLEEGEYLSDHIYYFGKDYLTLQTVS